MGRERGWGRERRARCVLYAYDTLYPDPPLINERRETCIVLALAVLYAVSDEVHHGFVPGRNAAVADVLIDSVGAGVGLFLYRGKSDTIIPGSKT